jgi:hypothetical protein
VSKEETSAIDAVSQAVYDCPMPDGDEFAVMVHLSDYIDGRVPIEAQLVEVRAICRTVAEAAIKAYLEYAP